MDHDELVNKVEELLKEILESPKVEKLPEGLRVRVAASMLAVEIPPIASALKLDPSHAVAIAAHLVLIVDDATRTALGEIIKKEGLDEIVEELLKDLEDSDG